MTPAAKPPLDEPIYERPDAALVDWHYEPDGTIRGQEYGDGYPVHTGRILVHDKRAGLARDVHQRVYTLARPGHKARDKELVDFLADDFSLLSAR